MSLLLVACLLAPVATPARQDASPPNVLLVLADDLGYGDLGCYNDQAKAPTPRLDALAAEGMRFTDAHSPSTVCTPTRYSVLTGRMAFRTGYRGVFTGAGGPCLIEEERPTLASVLRDAGYRTACVGKWHVGMTFFDEEGVPIHRDGKEAVQRVDFSRPIAGGPLERGFDSFFGTACCPTTDWLYAWIDGDRVPVPPTGVVDKSPLPDHPYSRDCRPGLIAPDYDLERVDLEFLARSQAFLREHAAERREQPFFLFHSMQAVHLPSFAAPEYQGRTQAGPHGDFLFEMDAVVGALLDTLEELDLAEDTLVVFTSDNGPEIASVVHMRQDHDHDGARPWRGIKRDQWEGGHRVPLIARWPERVPAGAVSPEPLCLTDLLATCARLAGAPIPSAAAEDSFDMSAVLLGEPEAGGVRPFLLHQTWTNRLSLREGRWKYLDHAGSGGNRYDRGPLQAFALDDGVPDAKAQLFDLEADPGETQNLVLERPEIAARLKGMLDATVAIGRSAPAR